MSFAYPLEWNPADDGHHPAGTVSFAAIGEEFVAAAPGAEAGIIKIFRPHSRPVRVGFQGAAQIQEIFPRRLCRRSQARSREFIIEKLRHFRPHFIAAASDSGPDGSQQIGRIHAEVCFHLTDRARQNVRKRPSPARMDRGYSSGNRIRDQHRQAIGGLNRQYHAFQAGDERIRFWLVPLAGIIPYDIHTIGMNLVQGDQARFVETDCIQEPPAVLIHTRGRVPGSIAEVHGAFGKRERAAPARGEAMAKASQLLKGTAAVYGYPPGLLKDESIPSHTRNIESFRRTLSTRFRSY